MQFRSSAWPLAWIWLALMVYASLHPFADWRLPPLNDWREAIRLLWPPMPRHSSTFDRWSNFLAYVPLGLLLAVGLLRSGQSLRATAVLAMSAPFLLSWSMETLQHLLPRRVPSRVDLALNSAGGIAGVLLALTLARLGGLDRWQGLRDRWLVPHGYTGMALVLSWPVALLFPPPVPFALGQGPYQFYTWLVSSAADSWLAAWLPEWNTVHHLNPSQESWVIALGMLAPCFVAYVMARQVQHRLVLLLYLMVFGLASTTLSTALNFAPEHAFAWFRDSMLPSMVWGVLAAGFMAWWPRKVVAVSGLIALVTLIVLLRHVSPDPYFADSLQGWEQGRFIRFHGLAQWVGWLWPFAAISFLVNHLFVAVSQLLRPPETHTPTIPP